MRAIAEAARAGFRQLDPDTYTSPGSALAARLAAGGVVDLAAGVAAGRLSNGFAIVRPPGHHAEADRAMGFCLFNNVAVAARALQAAGAARNVLIVDWDLHHGNGTQHAFREDPTVLYFSTHQFPFYPGTGGIDEIGGGEGRGFTVNVPLPGGMGDAEYVAAFDGILRPIAESFDPEIVLVSAGFDAAAGDPLGSMRVSPEGYAALTRRLLEFAGGRVVLALEGGYNLDAIARSASACVKTLLGAEETEPDFGEPGRLATAVLDAVKSVQKEFWAGL